MKFKIRISRLAAAFAGASLCFAASTAAFAEDPFADWQNVNEGTLFSERGGDIAVAVDDSALAAAVGLQHQTVTNTIHVTGNLSGGTINAGNGTFADQVMSLNVINTGNNVALQNQNVIAVTVVDSMITP
ncbi:hypothetical protein HBA54_02470 [Pelagibius litoralis]|uniref:Holdfast attachment protein HfaA n=1 Tax=Pelagibius litoralis TaxID=374515 RepID=A0A967C6V9_9PROT|nr:hypothetical protein [Pelagibius litoralis]NIA67447.1 hypothetical protein [Pelagibius litoralis]